VSHNEWRSQYFGYNIFSVRSLDLIVFEKDAPWNSLQNLDDTDFCRKLRKKLNEEHLDELIQTVLEYCRILTSSRNVSSHHTLILCQSDDKAVRSSMIYIKKVYSIRSRLLFPSDIWPSSFLFYPFDALYLFSSSCST
jgi:hypothetical protein